MKHLKIVATVLGALVISTSAYGQDTSTLKGALCSKVEDSLQRLSCFDRAFPKDSDSVSVVVNADEPVSAEDGWDIESTKSALDDSPTVFAVLRPSEVNGTGIGDASMALILRCSENTTSVLLATSMFMTGDTARVTVRVDDAPATSSAWPISTSYKSVGLWNGSKAIPFIKSIVEAERLVVRVEAKDRSDAQFTLGNIRSVAEQVSTACKWAL